MKCVMCGATTVMTNMVCAACAYEPGHRLPSRPFSQKGERIETCIGFDPTTIWSAASAEIYSAAVAKPFKPTHIYFPEGELFLIQEVVIGDKIQPMGPNVPGGWFKGDQTEMGRKVDWDVVEPHGRILIKVTNRLDHESAKFYGLVHGVTYR